MRNYIWNYLKRKQYMVAAGDAIVVLSLFLLCVHGTIKHMPPSVYVAVVIVIIVCHWIIFDLYDLYNLYELCKIGRSNILNHIIIPMVAFVLFNCFICICINTYYTNHIQVTRLSIYFLLLFVFVILWRYIVGEYIAKRWKPMRLAIIAPEAIVQSSHLDLKNIPLLSLSTHIFLSMDEPGESKEGCQNPNLQKMNRIAAFLKRRDFDVLAFYSSSGFLGDSEIEEILRLPADGKQVYDLFALYEILTGKVPLRVVNGQWLLKRSKFQSGVSRTYATIKRLLDVVVSALALGFLTPLMVLIGGAVKGGSRGPVIFVQERLGRNLKTFNCYKFRTMMEGAEDKCGKVWASPDDPRVTAIGRLLRESRLDELPQLWNVLKGDMTLVGPRPIRESFATELEEHIPFYRLRFCVKPGLTGWAQVNYDYAGSIEGQFEKFQYDLFYIENKSFLLDLLILFKTIKTVIRQRGT
jgi:exopolysaccharide biosynthesis polyprenyl glycosylphosphotransferase